MIFSPFEWMVAIRYLRTRRAEGFVSVITWFSLIGIALGVATLIIVMSVMNGFRQELFQRVIGLNGHLNVYPLQGQIFDYQQMLNNIQKVAGVTSASPTVEAQGLVEGNGISSGVYIRGVLPDVLRTRPTMRDHIVLGSLNDFGDDKIAIGLRLAERLQIKVGDRLTIISPVGKTTLFGSAPRMRSYPVAAIFNVGMYEYDSNFIFMPLASAQTFFDMGQGVSSLELFVQNPENMKPLRMDVNRLMGATQMPYRLLDWQDSNASFFTALAVERNVMFLILTLIIVVAAFNIISGLIMMVKDKGQSIAILRTMGASRGMIMRIFFLAGASVGLAGTILGTGLGLFLAYNIEQVRQIISRLTHTDVFAPEVYFLTRMPCRVDGVEVFQIVLMALILSFAATLYPSWRATKVNPIEGLRYE